jgi:hypothetical protein
MRITPAKEGHMFRTFCIRLLIVVTLLMLIGAACATQRPQSESARNAAAAATEAAAAATRSAALATEVWAAERLAQLGGTPAATPATRSTATPATTPKPTQQATKAATASVKPTPIATGEWEAQTPTVPTKAQVQMADGTQLNLSEPLSIQGDLEADCGWHFLELATSNLKEMRRLDDGRYLLVAQDGAEMTVSVGWSALFGMDEWGQKRVAIADTKSVAFQGGSPGSSGAVAMHWTVEDECGHTMLVGCPSESDWTTSFCLPGLSLQFWEFQLNVSPEDLATLNRAEAGQFRMRLADGTELSGLRLAQGTELTGQTAFGRIAVSLERVRSLLPAPIPQTPPSSPEWRVADRQGITLDASSLYLSDGQLAAYGLHVTSVDFERVTTVGPAPDGLSLQLPVPFGATQIISGTLSGTFGTHCGFTLPARNVASAERMAAVEPYEPPTVGTAKLSGGRDVPVSSVSIYGGDLPESVLGDVAEFDFYYSRLSERGFRIAGEYWTLPCTVSGVCPTGKPMSGEGGWAAASSDGHWEWEYAGALSVEAPFTDTEAYVPAQPPALPAFEPSVSLTVVNWQDVSATFLVTDVRFLQTRRLSGGWCCAGPSKYDYPSMNVIGLSDGVSRTVEIASLAAIEFDSEYSSSTSLTMRLISRQGGSMDVQLDPADPPGHVAFYWDRAREGLIADAGDGVSVIIRFAAVKRIKLEPVQ